VDVDQTSVRVAVRCRPLSQKEINEGSEECVEVHKDGQQVTMQMDAGTPHLFAFDHVFGKDSTQPEVFEALGSPLLDKSFQGYNSTIFAYGQTGSGKTHTMMSDRKSDDRGLIPRISENLFERITALTTGSRKFLVCCSFLEIYNEIVYDLLVPRGKSSPKTGLEIREQKGIGVYVKDLQEIVVESSEKLQKLIDQGFEHRATAATQMNATSSRSHCLFIIKMHQKDESDANNNNFSKMNLVDLAGSERASRTGAQGDTLKEGSNINKSLSSLGNVINALSKAAASGSKKVFIPYRDSKLTRVLQESLGGNALTTMMAAMSPAKTNFEETLSTLNYAKRAKTIKVNASKNDESEQISKLQSEVEALRAKLAEQASGVADTSKYEVQIEEMERFMKQTWDDKEKASVEHEEQRKKLETEAKKNAEKAVEEKNRRIKLLEDKGDIELSIQDLRSTKDDTSCWSHCCDQWTKNISYVLSLEQRISSQCRAVGLCKDSVMQDLDAWCQQRVKEGRDVDEGSAANRMLLSQAERKTASVLKELSVLERQERDLEKAVAVLTPEVRRMLKGVDMEYVLSKDEEKEEDKKDASKTEESLKVLSLIDRQLESHRATAWRKIAEDHRMLCSFTADGVKGLLSFCSSLGRDTEEITASLEIGGSSSSTQYAPTPRGSQGLLGAEVAAALGRPLGLACGDLPDSALTASSNQDAAPSCRLLDGVPVCAFGGWCPSKDGPGEYLQVDLGAGKFVCGFALQGRQPANGNWQRTRPLATKVVEPDPLPPERIFRRPPVRLIHDVVVAAVVRHKALAGQEGLADFSKEQLDYKHLQKADRQFKIDFFELLLLKLAFALKAVGVKEEEYLPLTLTSAEILGGKNTTESNRMLQLICFFALQQKGDMGGLLAVEDQWVTKFSVTWSVDGTVWAPIVQHGSKDPLTLDGVGDAETVKYVSLGDSMPSIPVRYIRVQPMEWHRHPGLRIEVYGWDEGADADKSSQPKERPKSKSGKKDAASAPFSMVERACRLEVLRAKTKNLQLAVEMAHAGAVEKWKHTQKEEAEQHKQQQAEKTQVEQQLADALQRMAELQKMHDLLTEKATDTEQSLIDADTEKLKTEVDRDRAEMQLKALEEKLEVANQGCMEEKAKVEELEKREEDLRAEREDLHMQVGVLTEERDATRKSEEELFENLHAKEEEVMNTNEGYCHLTDQIHEMREDYDEKIEQRDSVIVTLQSQCKQLSDEGITLRKEVADWKRKLTDAEKAINRAEAGLPSNYSYIAITPAALSPSKGAKSEKGKDDKKKKKVSESKAGGSPGTDYQDDFDDE